MNNIKRLSIFISLFNIIATSYVLIYHSNKTRYYIALIFLYIMYLIFVKSFQMYSKNSQDLKNPEKK
jgi:Ca2+/Na+ antiporter